MEQSANPAARVGYHTRTILASTQNAFVWSLTAASASICYAIYLVICNVNNNTRGISITFVRDAKKIGNKLLNKIICKIREIKMQKEIAKFRCGEKILRYQIYTNLQFSYYNRH